MGAGPFFAGESFSLVDAVFAPIFRYFDVFDEFIDLAVFAKTPKRAEVAGGACEAAERQGRGRG